MALKDTVTIQGRPVTTEKELERLLASLLQEFSVQDLLTAIANAMDQLEDS